MKIPRFRRQKSLNEAAQILKSLGYALDGMSGLDLISAGVAAYQQTELPNSRVDRWKLIAKFVGREASYTPHVGAKRAQRIISRENHKAAKERGPSFYESKEWMTLRYQVLRERGAKCECCGATRADDVVIQVDHVKPRSLFPELALDKANMQILCRPCNLGKSNKDDTDWREGATLQ